MKRRKQNNNSSPQERAGISLVLLLSEPRYLDAKLLAKLVEKGKMGPVVRLMPTSTAVQVRTKGEPMLIDGPFAETKEQFLGFYIVDCESIDEAIATARSLPTIGTIFEVRPVKLFFPGNGLKQYEA